MPDPTPTPVPDLGLSAELIAAIQQRNASKQLVVDMDAAEKASAVAMQTAIAKHGQDTQDEAAAVKLDADNKHAALTLFLRDMEITDVAVAPAQPS